MTPYHHISIPTPADHCVALLVADDILREDINI